MTDNQNQCELTDQLTYQVNNQSLILSTDMIQLTLALKLNTTPGLEITAGQQTMSGET